MSKLDKNSKDKLIDRIRDERTKFIEEFGAKPVALLLSRDNFLAVRNWMIANPGAEVIGGNMLYGMWIIMDPTTEDIHVGGL